MNDDKRRENTTRPAENKKTARFYSAEELAGMPGGEIPELYQNGKHLIYSSPATLAFNSPGAEGFGVKRAGLSIPGSVMLIVSPGCCGRNTAEITKIKGYEDRFFYLLMDETDVVTGRHLRKIPEAVKAVCESLPEKPPLVMICITCVDALLGTDMDRVSRKCEELAGTKVRPCYMYALTREGTRPPMVNVRQSLYSLIPKQKKRPTTVNFLGFFGPVKESFELRAMLKKIGVKRILSLAEADSFEEFEEMGSANFNLVLHPEARPAAADLAARLQMPYIELQRFYGTERIRRQYQALGRALGSELPDEEWRVQAEEAVLKVQKLGRERGKLSAAVGETVNGDPFEMALALLEAGIDVPEIFANVREDSGVYLRAIAARSPKTRIYSNMEPTMLYYDSDKKAVDIAVGRDAVFYHPEAEAIPWCEDEQPYGYAAVTELFERICRCMADKADPKEAESRIKAENGAAAEGRAAATKDRTVAEASRGADTLQQICSDGTESAEKEEQRTPSLVKGLRLRLTPFAPDQSGAEEVLFGMPNLSIVLDAGGCTGNICGFDEPRWKDERSALFSAGLRDMDAILGRDRELIEKLNAASAEIDAEFTALIGTPVPAVSATDYQALCKMAEKKTGRPAVAADTNGMELYDRGEQKMYEALFRKFSGSAAPSRQPVSSGGLTGLRIGVIGAIPLEGDSREYGRKIEEALYKRGAGSVCIYGGKDGLDHIRNAGEMDLNYVVSPAGLSSAVYLKKKFGTPFAVEDPSAEALTEEIRGCADENSSVLIVHQQVFANSLRDALASSGIPKDRICAATYFLQLPGLRRDGDVQLKEEYDLPDLVEKNHFDVIIGDPELKKLLPEYRGRWIPAVHFAVSGELL
ncbi:MAG: nitrogenase component 1 [Lachnospiraceae bacterium]|nr:nitrogenase component 1 [Lachnospiraceae bacterium]